MENYDITFWPLLGALSRHFILMWRKVPLHICALISRCVIVLSASNCIHFQRHQRHLHSFNSSNTVNGIDMYTNSINIGDTFLCFFVFFFISFVRPTSHIKSYNGNWCIGTWHFEKLCTISRVTTEKRGRITCHLNSTLTFWSQWLQNIHTQQTNKTFMKYVSVPCPLCMWRILSNSNT